MHAFWEYLSSRTPEAEYVPVNVNRSGGRTVFFAPRNHKGWGYRMITTDRFRGGLDVTIQYSPLDAMVMEGYEKHMGLIRDLAKKPA